MTNLIKKTDRKEDIMNRIKKLIATGTLVCVMATTATVTMPLGESASIVHAASNIGIKKAKSIALKHANLKSSDVTFTKAKLDKDDGLTIYEIKFTKGNDEYEYEINAKTGKIVSYDYDLDDDYVVDDITTSTKNIGKTKAKSIALKHANLKESDVDYIKVKLDHDDGVAIYDVDIYDDNMEYSYEINAKTGKIIEWEKDYDD